MNKSSTWTAPRNPAFRKLWIATVISGTCLAVHDSVGTWMMNIATGSPFLPSIMSTVCFVNVGLAATAAGLAVLGWLHLLNPYLIVVSVFLIGVGFAFDAGASTSIAPQIVSDAELPFAATLSGLQFNISGIIGPMLGGFLVPLAGANFVFGLSSSNLGLLFTSMGAGSVVGAVFIIPPLRASLRQLKAAVEYGQVMPNIPQMGHFFSSMNGALQIAAGGRAYHRRPCMRENE